jgi:hypothetical protein
MKCVPREEGKGILEEIHKGVCGNHASSRTLVSKAFRQAFYWPTALGDAEELVRRCQGCQYFAKQQNVPAYKLVTIPPTWPFACWGLDMIGPLPTAPGGLNRVLVAIDKFTKWIEVKPVACPKADRVLDFLDELVHRYRLPPSHHHKSGLQLQSPVLGVLRERQDRRSICLSCPSSGQWTLRARQWDGTRRSQEATARGC